MQVVPRIRIHSSDKFIPYCTVERILHGNYRTVAFSSGAVTDVEHFYFKTNFFAEEDELENGYHFSTSRRTSVAMYLYLPITMQLSQINTQHSARLFSALCRRQCHAQKGDVVAQGFIGRYEALVVFKTHALAAVRQVRRQHRASLAAHAHGCHRRLDAGHDLAAAVLEDEVLAVVEYLPVRQERRLRCTVR